MKFAPYICIYIYIHIYVWTIQNHNSAKKKKKNENVVPFKNCGQITDFLFWGRFNFFASKEAYLIVIQSEKITVKKVQAKVLKCVKNKSWVPRNPPPWSLKC